MNRLRIIRTIWQAQTRIGKILIVGTCGLALFVCVAGCWLVVLRPAWQALAARTPGPVVTATSPAKVQPTATSKPTATPTNTLVPSMPTERLPMVKLPTVHWVKPGDTIWTLGQIYGVPASAICQANNLADCRRISTGQSLIIPEPDTVTLVPTPAPSEKPIEHTMALASPGEPGVVYAAKGPEWEIQYYAGATEQMRGWAFPDLEPLNWPEFPNVDNSRVGFEAKDGLEYGMDESAYCQQVETCDVVVPAMHYRIVSGDYTIAGDACAEGEAGIGCGIMLVNVGLVTASFEDANVDSGFTVWGRYWNGDTLPTGIWGGLSHVASNMLNLQSTLNPTGSVNAGSNCSNPGGCQGVRLVFIITSGNELLVKGITTIYR